MKYIELAAKIIKEFEGYKSVAYKCPAGVWTIGYGSTYYENRALVKAGDTVTLERADKLLLNTISEFDKGVRSLATAPLNNGQRAALISFAFNVGLDIDKDFLAEGLGDSSLLKKVNANPSDPNIRTEFMKWVNAGGRKLPGLVRRRRAEADLYFSGQ